MGSLLQCTESCVSGKAPCLQGRATAWLLEKGALRSRRAWSAAKNNKEYRTGALPRRIAFASRLAGIHSLTPNVICRGVAPCRLQQQVTIWPERLCPFLRMPADPNTIDNRWRSSWMI